MKIHEVAQGHITKVLNGRSVQNLSEQPIAMFDRHHRDLFVFLEVFLEVSKVCFKDGCQRLSKDESMLV